MLHKKKLSIVEIGVIVGIAIAMIYVDANFTNIIIPTTGITIPIPSAPTIDFGTIISILSPTLLIICIIILVGIYLKTKKVKKIVKETEKKEGGDINGKIKIKR
jgi:hypothetical protein